MIGAINLMQEITKDTFLRIVETHSVLLSQVLVKYYNMLLLVKVFHEKSRQSFRSIMPAPTFFYHKVEVIKEPHKVLDKYFRVHGMIATKVTF